MRGPAGAAGFTVVELVVVLLLLGILSAVALPRFVSSDAFTAVILAEYLHEEVAYARQLASSRQDTVASFRLSVLADSWRLETATVADGVLREGLVPNGSLSVRVANGGAPVALSVGEALALQFDGRGALASATAGSLTLNPSVGIDLEINGAARLELCIYPTGALSDAPCV